LRVVEVVDDVLVVVVGEVVEVVVVGARVVVVLDEFVVVVVVASVVVVVVVSWTSNAPMSMRLFTTRGKPEPRWSSDRGGVKELGSNAGSPASMAGLTGDNDNACVKVGPPLSCNGPSFGSVLRMSPVAFSSPPGPVEPSPPAASLLRL